MKKYSIVAYLEGGIKAEVRALQEKLFELTGSRECLDAWQPHLTVGDGILVDQDKLVQVENDIAELTKNESPFQVSLEGFGGLTDRQGGEGEITTPYVLWVDVVVNKELIGLVEKVEDIITSKCELWYQMPKPYTPHVTVAFRDLSEDGHRKGLDYLKNCSFNNSAQISHIALVEKLPTSDIEYKRFGFKS